MGGMRATWNGWRWQHHDIKDEKVFMSQENSGTDKPIQPNEKNHYEITETDIPLHCPMDGMSLWNSHPKVYLSLNEHGKAKCPYCGADYTMKNNS